MACRRSCAIIIEFHRKLLGDGIRNQAFYEALKRVIVPGKTIVADIGAGTGFLSFLAAKLGARRCYLYEHSGAIRLAKQLAGINRIKNCEFIHRHSADVKRPPKVDVVISETLGNFAYEENIIETIEDAKRYLKPGGIIIPQILSQYVAPVISERLYREINIYDKVGYGLDLRLAKKASLNNMYVKPIPADEVLRDSKLWDRVDFRRTNPSIREGTTVWKLNADVRIWGFCLWWECELLEGVQISTSPFERLTHWEQNFMPVLEPIDLRAGEALELTIYSDSRYKVGIDVSWEVRLNSGKPQKMGIRQGDLDSMAT